MGPLARLATPVALVLLAGVALPLSHGIALPMVVLVAALTLLVAAGAGALTRSSGAPAGDVPGPDVGLGPGRPDALVQARVLWFARVSAAGVVLAVAARGVGALLVAHPAAVWALAALVAAALLAGLIALLGAPARARALGVALGLAAIVPASLAGARWEAAGPDARGWALTGPILGIHPFQTLAVIVDGHGPFDLPVNDYVEPDASRGYGPETLAALYERSLQRIAELHFADGPARARLAFAGAKVEAIVTDPVQESLDRAPNPEPAQRIRVTSGSWGQRSRVQFVCPGTALQPGPRAPDPVLQRMCPDKYASEASAGLGLTGRWAGYVEGRGNERFGWSRWGGRVRTDDRVGAIAAQDELERWAFVTVALVLAAAGLLAGAGAASAGPRPGQGHRREVVAAVLAAGGGLAGLALLVAAGAAIVAAGGALAVDAWSPLAGGLAGAADATIALGGWAIAVALLVGLGVRAHVRSEPVAAGPAADGTGWATGLGLVLGAGVGLWTWGFAHAPGLAALARPRLWPLWREPAMVSLDLRDAVAGVELPLEGVVAAIAEACTRVGLDAALGVDVLALEAIAAGALVSALLGGACAAAAWATATPSTAPLTAGGAAEPSVLPDAAPRWIAWALLAVIAAGLIVSRKTLGGATLLPGAMVAVWGATALAGPVPATRGRARAAIGIALAVVAGIVLAHMAAPEALRTTTFARLTLLVGLAPWVGWIGLAWLGLGSIGPGTVGPAALGTTPGSGRRAHGGADEVAGRTDPRAPDR